MNNEQKALLIKRFIIDPQVYKGIEPQKVRIKNDLNFCQSFFGQQEINEDLIKSFVCNAVENKKEDELDLLLMLIEHFCVVKLCNLMLAKLLIQPWHNLHDRIAGILEFNANEELIEYLYRGALYRCENLDYESDYCEFNRKCMHALARIGTIEAINYLRKVTTCDNIILKKHAQTILDEYNH